MTESEKNFEENKKKLLFGLAILLGGMTVQEINDAQTFEDLPQEAVQKALQAYAKDRSRLDSVAKKEELTQPQVQQAVHDEALKTRGSRLYRIENPGDSATCEKCREWIGKTVADDDPNYPSVQDWMNSGALHPNCRCSLHEIEEVRQAQLSAQDYVARRTAREQELAAYNVQAGKDGLVFN